MPEIAVVFDRGPVSAGQIAVGLAPLGTVTFVVPGSEYATAQLPLLRELGDVDERSLLERSGARFDAILTFSERMLEDTARLARVLRLPFHAEETVSRLTVKSAQRQRLREAGVDVVRCREIAGPGGWDEAVQHVGLPAVLKPVRGEGSRDTLLVERDEDGRDAVAEYFRHAGKRRDVTSGRGAPPLLLEEFLRGRDEAPFGDYVSVESAVSGGEVMTIAVTGKYPLLKPFREIGNFWPSHLGTRDQEEVAHLATGAVEALGVRIGLTHTEIKLTAAGPRIIEVNGRLGGMVQELSLHSAGVDLVTLAGRMALNPSVPASALIGAPPPCENGVLFIAMNPSPTQPCRLDSVSGIREARKVEGIIGYQLFERPGSQLPGGVMTGRLDQFIGTAPDHGAMFPIIEEIRSRLTFTFTDDEGRSWQRNGVQLMQAGAN